MHREGSVIPAVKASRRAPAFRDVPVAQWNDWRWQLGHRLNKAEELAQVFPLSDSERAALAQGGLFRVEVTPYFASLIRPEDPADPIRRQVIPTATELEPFTAMMEDSLAEDRHSPVPGLVHRYPDRVLMLVTTQCASYCRYCTRSRIVGDPSEQFSSAEYEEQLDYIRRTPQIRDVLLSGGDPLTLAPKVLENLIASLRGIEHVEIIRIGSRVPVFMPMRVDEALCEMLEKYHPIWLNIHVNHPNEITPELAAATDKLSRAGIPLGNQSVLLAGVNDCVHIQRRLVQELLRIRVRPYYLYQCDLVEGAGHFRTPVAKGIEIVEGLRGHTSGFAVPTFVIDAPGGGGKIPLGPNYLLSMSDHRVALRNYEGYISVYEEPTVYPGHDPETCPECRRKRGEAGQSGITGLLDGDELAIEPQDWARTHARGGAQHRLNRNAEKWNPRGIGHPASGGEGSTARRAESGKEK
jgi:lysine 2,3-aminomutase